MFGINYKEEGPSRIFLEELFLLKTEVINAYMVYPISNKRVHGRGILINFIIKRTVA